MVVSTTEKQSMFCSDAYMLGYVGSFDVTWFESSWWSHSINWPGNALRDFFLFNFVFINLLFLKVVGLRANSLIFKGTEFVFSNLKMDLFTQEKKFSKL